MDVFGEEHMQDESHQQGPALDFATREVALRADLADRDSEDCIWTSVRFVMRGPRPPRPGESVMLIDVDGGSCMGRVVSFAGWKACIRPDWSTWSGTSGPPARRVLL